MSLRTILFLVFLTGCASAETEDDVKAALLSNVYPARLTQLEKKLGKKVVDQQIEDLIQDALKKKDNRPNTIKQVNRGRAWLLQGERK